MNQAWHSSGSQLVLAAAVAICLSACQAAPTKPLFKPSTSQTKAQTNSSTANVDIKGQSAVTDTQRVPNNPSDANLASTASSADSEADLSTRPKPLNKPSEMPTPIPKPKIAPAPVNNESVAKPLQNAGFFEPVNVLPEHEQAQRVSLIRNPKLAEISGMAFSKRSPGTLWMINDSGNEALLFALDTSGNTLAQWQVGAPNRDWEDLASVEFNGDAYLLIADIGDNLAIKKQHSIFVIREPEMGDDPNTVLKPIEHIRFSYSDGSHNAESIATDGQQIYIATKHAIGIDGPVQSTLYSLPLTIGNVSNNTLVATPIAAFPKTAQNLEAKLVAAIAGQDLNQPTAMDIDTLSNKAYILSYRSVLQIEHPVGEPIGREFANQLKRIHSHRLAQAEALAVDARGNVWFTSEKLPAPLWVLPIQ